MGSPQPPPPGTKTKPPTPDGIPNFDETDASAQSSTTTAKTDIWSIPPDLIGKDIYTQYGSSPKYNQQTRRRLDAADQAAQSASYETQRETIGEDVNTGTPNNTYVYPVSLFGDNPQLYLQLQRALFSAGYYGSRAESSMRWGGDVAGTMDAWSNLLRDTIQQQKLGKNVTWQDVLQNTITATQKAGGDAQQKIPTINNYTDPKAVAFQAQQAAQATLGRNLSDSELQHFVSEFRAAEVAFNKTDNAIRQDTTGATFNSTKPDLEGDAGQYVQDNFKTEIAGNNMADYALALEQMLNVG